MASLDLTVSVISFIRDTLEDNPHMDGLRRVWVVSLASNLGALTMAATCVLIGAHQASYGKIFLNPKGFRHAIKVIVMYLLIGLVALLFIVIRFFLVVGDGHVGTAVAVFLVCSSVLMPLSIYLNLNYGLYRAQSSPVDAEA